MARRPEAEGPIDRQRRFDQIYRRHERRLLGYALRRAPTEAAKDAVAETFLAAWRRLDELPPDPLPWLIAATRRTLANQRRSSGRQLLLAERLARELRTAAGEEHAAHETTIVDDAFAQLALGDREVLALVAWDGLTNAQAASSLGCSAVAFRVRLHRARRRLAAALDGTRATVQAEAGGDHRVPRAKEVC